MKKHRVVYFTGVDVGAGAGGGSICCRSHIRSLAGDAAIDLSIVIAASASSEAATRSMADSFGVPLEFISSHSVRRVDPLRKLNYMARKYPFTFEKNLGNRKHIDQAFEDYLSRVQPDVVVVDHLPSALLVPSLFRTSIPRCVIKLNREADFHVESHVMRGANPESFLMRWALRRWVRIEQAIHEACDGVIALTENDLPIGDRRPPVLAAIPPFLEMSRQKWSYSGNRRVTYVGSIDHFPNFYAIKWICTRMAPLVAALDPTIKFRVIGVALSDVAPEWRHPSVEFLGRSEKAELENEFIHNDLFLAPISNNYGSKIKLLECVTYGTPFLANEAALSGLSFLRGIPKIDLDDPQSSAQTLADLINGIGSLPELSQNIGAQVVQFQAQQVGVWGRTLEKVIAAAALRDGQSFETSSRSG